MKLFRLFVNLFQFNRTNWQAVLLCFLTAAIFWVFNALNKTYNTNLTFPLQIQYDEARYVAAAMLPQEVTLNVAGQGWDLVRKNLGLRVPLLTLPIERPLETKSVPGSALPAIFGAQLPTLKINFAVTDSLRLALDLRAKRKLKLVANLQALTFREGLGRVSKVVVLPDSIELTGPAQRLRALPDTLVIAVAEKKVSTDFREQLDITFQGMEFFDRQPSTVEVIFEVDRFTRLTRRIPLLHGRLPRDVVIHHDSVSATFELPQKMVEAFNQQFMQALLPEVYLQRNTDRKFSPQVVLPEFVRLVAIDSVSVQRQ